MPINAPSPIGGGTSNRISIEIVAKADQVIRELERTKKELKELRKEEARALAEADKAAAAASANRWTEFRSAYSTVLDVIRGGKQVWDATVGALVEYSEQVQKLSVITGQSAEETSRQIDLAGDLRVSYESLARSLQFASKKGFDTSIEGLIKLGEEYKKLPEGIARTQFLVEKFGKSGIDMNRILGQTAEKIREIAGSTPEGLIIKEKDLVSIRIYNQQMDELADKFEGFKLQAGRGLIGIITGSTVEIQKNAQAIFKQAEGYNFNTNMAGRYTDAQRAAWQEAVKLAEQQFAAAHGIDTLGDSAMETEDDLSGLADSEKALEQATKQLSSAYQGVLSAMFTIQSGNDKFAETMDSLIQKDTDLAEQKKRLTLEWWAAQAAGEATSASYSKYAERMIEVTQAEEVNAAAKEKLVEDQKKAAQQRVFDLTRERLAADGLIDSGEYEFLQNLAVQRGLVSRAAADQAIAESKQADDLVANFAKTQPVMKNTLDTMQSIAALNGTIVQFGVNFSTMGFLPATTEAPLVGGSGGGIFRDSGGYGDAGMPYLIGTGAQPEMFIPDTPGTFIPNADKLGPTINISVGAINNRADIDYLAQEVARRVAKV